MPIEVTANSATGGTMSPLPGSPGRARMNAAAQLPSTALTGTPLAPTLLQTFQPGTARSRENAKNVREQLVTQAMPQKSWPITAIRMIASAQPWLIGAEVNTEIDVPKASLTAPTSVAANVIASSTNQPISAEQATDCQTPLAAACSASWVSSETCAEAS